MAEFLVEQRDSDSWVFAKCASHRGIFLFGSSIDDVKAQAPGTLALLKRVRDADARRHARIRDSWHAVPSGDFLLAG